MDIASASMKDLIKEYDLNLELLIKKLKEGYTFREALRLSSKYADKVSIRMKSFKTKYEFTDGTKLTLGEMYLNNMPYVESKVHEFDYMVRKFKSNVEKLGVDLSYDVFFLKHKRWGIEGNLLYFCEKFSLKTSYIYKLLLKYKDVEKILDKLYDNEEMKTLVDFNSLNKKEFCEKHFNPIGKVLHIKNKDVWAFINTKKDQIAIATSDEKFYKVCFHPKDDSFVRNEFLFYKEFPYEFKELFCEEFCNCTLNSCEKVNGFDKITILDKYIK